jgi:hypothetical protein
MGTIEFPKDLPADTSSIRSAVDVMAAYQHGFNTRSASTNALTGVYPQFQPGYGPVILNPEDYSSFDAFISKMTSGGWSRTPMQSKIVAAGRNAVAMDAEFQRITVLGDTFYTGRGLYVAVKRMKPLTDAEVSVFPEDIRESVKHWGLVFRGQTEKGHESGVPYPDGSEVFTKAAAAPASAHIPIPLVKRGDMEISTREYVDCRAEPIMGCIGAYILERRGCAFPLWYSPGKGQPRIINTEAELGQPLVDVEDIGLRARILFEGETMGFLDVLVTHDVKESGPTSLLAVKEEDDWRAAEKGPKRLERCIVGIEKSEEGDEWPWKVKSVITIE